MQKNIYTIGNRIENWQEQYGDDLKSIENPNQVTEKYYKITADKIINSDFFLQQGYQDKKTDFYGCDLAFNNDGFLIYIVLSKP